MSNEKDQDFKEKYHPLYLQASAILDRCTKDDVPSDVFKMIAVLTMDIYEDERKRIFTKPEKFILKMFKRI